MLPRGSGTCQDPFQRSVFYCRPDTRSVERKCQRDRAASTINIPLQQNKHGCLDRALMTFDPIPGEQTQRHRMMKTQAVRGRRFVVCGEEKGAPARSSHTQCDPSLHDNTKEP